MLKKSHTKFDLTLRGVYLNSENTTCCSEVCEVEPSVSVYGVRACVCVRGM